ncbi:MAG: PIN domain-containing protein [Acidimicrobiia bacterium]
MRLFLDANVLFTAAVSPEGTASKLFAFAEAGACELVTSAFAVAEAARNLRAKAPEAVDRWERSSASVGIVSEADPRLVERLAVPLPAKDRPILAAALGCRASVLVTGDRKHFGPLFGRSFGGTVVLSPREALAFVVEVSGA